MHWYYGMFRIKVQGQNWEKVSNEFYIVSHPKYRNQLNQTLSDTNNPQGGQNDFPLTTQVK
jgi:hypothetical protein